MFVFDNVFDKGDEEAEQVEGCPQQEAEQREYEAYELFHCFLF
jgi:hypothetical protein